MREAQAAVKSRGEMVRGKHSHGRPVPKSLGQCAVRH